MLYYGMWIAETKYREAILTIKETRSFTLLAEKHRTEIDEILAKYPPERRRSAVMPLLHLAQCEDGEITPEVIDEIAGLLDMSSTQVSSLIGFYTLYHEKPGGKYRVQICTDLPCALRGSEDFANELCDRLGIRMGETTVDGLITVEGVMCLASCDKAPMFQVQGPDGIHYHELQTVDTAMMMIEGLRKGEADA
jgi:NADH-quinone oxidoreductase subunit E